MQDILHIRRNNFIFHVVVFLAIEGKEVTVQDDTDALQQACVDTLALEDIVHVGAVTMQLVGEPGHTPLLTLQLCLDFFADVYSHYPIVDPTAGTCCCTITNVSCPLPDAMNNSPCKITANCNWAPSTVIAENTTHV